MPARALPSPARKLEEGRMTGLATAGTRMGEGIQPCTAAPPIRRSLPPQLRAFWGMPCRLQPTKTGASPCAVSIVLTGPDRFTSLRIPAQKEKTGGQRRARGQREAQPAPIRLHGRRSATAPHSSWAGLQYPALRRSRSRSRPGIGLRQRLSEKEEGAALLFATRRRPRWRHGELVFWRRARARGFQGGRFP